MDGKTGTRPALDRDGRPDHAGGHWGGQCVWQQVGAQASLQFGRPIWVSRGRAVRLQRARREGRADGQALHAHARTSLMAALDTLVDDLRDRYPARWTRDG